MTVLTTGRRQARGGGVMQGGRVGTEGTGQVGEPGRWPACHSSRGPEEAEAEGPPARRLSPAPCTTPTRDTASATHDASGWRVTGNPSEVTLAALVTSGQ